MTIKNLLLYNNVEEDLLYLIKIYLIQKILSLPKKKDLNINSFIFDLKYAKNYEKLKEITDQIIKIGIKNLRNYTIPLYLFYKFILNQQIQQVDLIEQEHLNKFLDESLRTKKVNTKKSYFYHILSFFKFIDKQPLNYKFNFNNKYFKKRYETKFTEDENLSIIDIKLLINCINMYSKSNINKRLILKLIVYGACSVNEIINLEKNHCKIIDVKDIEYLKIQIESGKKSERIFYVKYSFIKKEYELILSCLENKKYLFNSNRNKKYAQITIYKYINNFLIKSDLNLTLFEFTNSFVLYLIQKGEQIDNLYTLFGNINEKMQKYYFKDIEKIDKIKALNELNL